MMNMNTLLNTIRIIIISTLNQSSVYTVDVQENRELVRPNYLSYFVSFKILNRGKSHSDSIL